jgi:hypothetical protein
VDGRVRDHRSGPPRARGRGGLSFAQAPPPRGVGGVRIAAGEPDWRWDEQRRDAVSTGTR